MTSAPSDETYGVAGWRDRLYVRMAGQPTPMLILPDHVWTAASLWAGARQWTRALREAGVGAGDRIICALPAGAPFVQLLVAALWENLTLAIVSPRDVSDHTADALLTALDARLLIAAPTVAAATFTPGAAGWPDTPLPPLRAMQYAAEPDARLLLRTSGTSGRPRWIALSDANLFAVLDSHAAHRDLRGASVLSVLPWHHAFGLVLGLLSALLEADEIVRDGAEGRDVQALLSLTAVNPITHVDLVPLLATRLFEHADGHAFLRHVRGGIVGGAPVSAVLAEQLAQTQLRVGYGQTEAAPGILLGDVGAWSPYCLGRPVGCEVRTDADGVLAFRGPNAYLGEWRGGALQRRAADAWVRTGDVVVAQGDGSYRFVGRVSDAFKLANGRFVDAPHHEDALRGAFPQASQLLLRASDDDALELLVTAPAGSISVAAAQQILGALGDQLRRVTYVDGHAWHYTPKGDVNRVVPLR